MVLIPNRAIQTLVEKRQLLVGRLLKCRISSDLEVMDEFHSKYSWIPSSKHIRPTEDTIRRKQAYLTTEVPKYETSADFILHNIFGLTTIRHPNSQKLCVQIPPEAGVNAHSLRVTVRNLSLTYSQEKPCISFIGHIRTWSPAVA